MTNALNALLAKTTGNPTKTELKTCLKQYQDSRVDRVGAMLITCNMLTRIQAMKNWIFYLYAYFIGPLRGDEFMVRHQDLNISLFQDRKLTHPGPSS